MLSPYMLRQPGKSWLVPMFIRFRQEHLAEQRRIACYGVSTAAAYIASLKK